MPTMHTKDQKALLLVVVDFMRDGIPCIEVLSANQCIGDFFASFILCESVNRKITVRGCIVEMFSSGVSMEILHTFQ